MCGFRTQALVSCFYLWRTNGLTDEVEGGADGLETWDFRHPVISLETHCTSVDYMFTAYNYGTIRSVIGGHSRDQKKRNLEVSA